MNFGVVLLVAISMMVVGCGEIPTDEATVAEPAVNEQRTSASSTTVAPTTTTTAPTTTTTIATTTTTIPPALDIETTGDDVIRIFRELDAAYEYLTEFPDAADPYDYFEENGGARTLAFMAERGFFNEPTRPGDTRDLLEVEIQGWSSDEYVQLFVVESRDEVGRRVIDGDGNTRIEDYGWDSESRLWVVGMRRGSDGWRIVERVPVYGREGNPFDDYRYFTPRTIPPIDETNRFASGTALDPEGNELAWEAHSYRSANSDDHCIEIRVPGEERIVNCLDAGNAKAMEDSVTYIWNVLRDREMGLIAGFGPNLPVTVGVDFGDSGVVGLQPARIGNIGAFAHVTSTWVEEISVHFEGRYLGGDAALASYTCGVWSDGGGPRGTVMAGYSESQSSRKATSEEIEIFVLQHVQDWYVLPDLTITRTQPDNFDAEVFDTVAANTQWFVVEASDWQPGIGETSRTWAMLLDEGPNGWFLADGRFRQDCPE